MADAKISELTALVTQATNDLYETSANGTGSFKETRAQQTDYMQDTLDFIHTTGSVSLGDIPVYGADGKNAKSSGTNISVSLDATGFKSVAVTQDPTSALQLTTKQYVDARAPLTTKGDLYTYSTTPSRLSIGANSTILMADSTQTTGNKWTTATYPATTTANTILYSSATNTISEITTANNGVLATSASGVPSVNTNFKLGTSNTVIGSSSGSSALFSQTATQNVVIGTDAGAGISGTGQGNHTIIGYQSGQNLTDVSGQVNVTAIGNSAARNAQGFNITAIGSGAAEGQGGGLATGEQNVAIGANTMGLYESGSFNTAIGDTCCQSISTGSRNVAIGAVSAPALTSGSGNVLIGYGAPPTLVSGDDNILIGTDIDVDSSSATNRIGIGTSVLVNANNKMVLGNTSITSIKMANTVYPATTTINQILYSSSSNTITGLTTANNGVLVTSAGGVPSISLTLPSAVQGNITAVGTIASGTWNGTNIDLSHGGTNASLTASNGGIFYSTATAGAILAGTATAGQMLRSGSSSAPSWSTATWPSTTTANRILYSSATNTVSEITSANSAVLVTNSSGVPAFSGTMTNGQLIIGSTGATPTAATITAGSGISITNGAGSISIAVTGGGMPTVEVTGTSVSMSVNTRYVLNNASLVTATLPTTFSVGDVIEVIGKGAGGWKVAQNSGQIIHSTFGDTTTGTGGSLSSTNRYDRSVITGITANTDLSVQTMGTLTNV